MTLKETVLIGTIGGLVGSLIALPFTGKHKKAEKPEAIKVILTETSLSWGGSQTIRTVIHDGHWFIYARGGEGVSIINHPSCPKCPTVKWIAP